MHHLIIGNSAAGLSAVKGIRLRDTNSSITILSEEKYAAYSRILLPSWIKGSVPLLSLCDWSFYETNQIQLTLNSRVNIIDPESQVAVTADGRNWAYDRVLVATGASPSLPKLEGYGLLGSTVMRTLNRRAVGKEFAA